MEQILENSEKLDTAYLKGSINPAQLVSSFLMSSSKKHHDMVHNVGVLTTWIHPGHKQHPNWMAPNEHYLVLEAGNNPCCSGGEQPGQDRQTKHYHRLDSNLLHELGVRSHQNLLNQLQKDVPHHEQVSYQVPQHQLHEQVDNLPLPPEKKTYTKNFRHFQLA